MLASLQPQPLLLSATVAKNCCSTQLKKVNMGIHLLQFAFPCTASAAKHF